MTEVVFGVSLLSAPTDAAQRRIARMEPVSLRAKLSWVAAGYAAVLAASTFLVIGRYLQYTSHPQDANQYGGMLAGGDMVIGVLILLVLIVESLVVGVVGG